DPRRSAVSFGEGLLTRPSSATDGLPVPDRWPVTWRPPVGRTAIVRQPLPRWIVGVRRRCRAPSRLQHSPPGRGSPCYDMLRFPVSAAVWRAKFSAQVNLRYYFTSISILTLVGRDSRLNCLLTKELRRNELRSRFLKKSPFRALFRAFYLHTAHKSALRAEGATHFRTRGKPGWPPTSANVSLPPVLPPHAPCSTPQDASTSGGQVVLGSSPTWLLPNINRRFVKERTGPNRDERPFYLSMSPNRAIRAD